MNEPHLSIGPLMKAARKFKKFNQSDVANAIGCSQSALSKMEHNLLIPNAPQWFLFSRFTSIPPETIEMGIIDRHSLVKLNNDSVSVGFKLPKRYKVNRSQKVREVYPLLTYLEKKLNNNAFKQFNESIEIDEEFFLDFDNLVNFQLLIDLINFYVRIGKTASKDIQDVVNYGQDQFYWDKLGEEWKGLKGPEEVLYEYAKAQTAFQVDFKINVELIKNVLMVSYLPEPHVYHYLKDVGEETKHWLGIYRKLTLEGLVKKALGVAIEARLVPEHSTSLLDHRFEIH